MREHAKLRGRLRFGLFNLLFISLYQNILIFLFSSPLLLASLYPDRSLTIVDCLAAIMMLIFIITESIADNQLFKFHQEKKKNATGGKMYVESLKKGKRSCEGPYYLYRQCLPQPDGTWIPAVI